MKFLIQTINGEIKYDFCFKLLEAIEFNNWFHPNDKIEYIKCELNWLKDINHCPTATEIIKETYKECCPIGSVEFVHRFYEYIFNIKNIKPLNIPSKLMDYIFTNRLVGNYSLKEGDIFPQWNECEKDFFTSQQAFIKSNDVIKHPLNGWYNIEQIKDLEFKNFQISEACHIITEYRCFVFDNKLVGIHYYSGDFTLFPQIVGINDMIKEYASDAPIAYTLDIGTNEKHGAFVIECHDFYSCGLYGFSDLNKLPLMFWRWHKEFLNKNKKNEINSNK